jgi:hypothetical protein
VAQAARGRPLHAQSCSNSTANMDLDHRPVSPMKWDVTILC